MPMVASRSGLAAMTNAHTPVFRPLARDRDSLSLLAGELFDAGTRSVVVSSLPMEDDARQALVDAARARGRLIDVGDGLISPVVETSGDFASWREMSKPRWHSPLERYRRKMSRDHEARFQLLQAPRELDETFESGLVLERSGWKGRAGTAILSRPETTDFYSSVASAFARRGELSVSSIHLDGQMVTFDLCLLDRGRLYLLKTAYDESMRRLAPGLVLRLSVIERCFEIGLSAHELLGGADAYKLTFSTSERRHVEMRCYRRLPIPAAQYAYLHTLKPGLRTVYRSLRRKHSNRGT